MKKKRIRTLTRKVKTKWTQWRSQKFISNAKREAASPLKVSPVTKHFESAVTISPKTKKTGITVLNDIILISAWYKKELFRM